MKLLLAYLRLHIKSIILFCVFGGVFCIVFALSSAPLDAVVYAILLCFVLALVIAVIGFIRFCKKHRFLVSLENAVTVSLSELPDTHNLIEKDYTLLLQALFDEKTRIESEYSASVTSLTDYYTLWAHQIKTPIAAMRLLLQSGDSGSAELEEQLFRIERYVDMVLQYVRTESPSTDYVIKKCSIDDTVRECLRKYAKLFIRKKLSLKFKPMEAFTVTDRKWLSFVICQLLDNAVKYTPEGGTVTIYLKPDAPCTLVIEDSGIGIEPDDLPRVCDKGYTGYNGRVDKKSTGIGLYLCRQIMTKLSHTLTLESEPGKGTRVLLRLETRQVIE